MEIERGEACRLCSLREKEEDEQCSFAREASDYIWTVSVLRQLKLQSQLQLHPILVLHSPFFKFQPTSTRWSGWHGTITSLTGPLSPFIHLRRPQPPPCTAPARTGGPSGWPGYAEAYPKPALLFLMNFLTAINKI